MSGRPPVAPRLALLIALLAAPACGGGGRGLLGGAQASRVVGIANPALITDGRAALEGDDWNSPSAALFESESGHVDFDLGAPTPIVAGYLQGDNNDEYIISVSDDGVTFRELWVAPPRPAAGLRERWADNLGGNGRWVRLSGRGGDRVFSVAELQLYAQRPEPFPPRVTRAQTEAPAAQVRTALIYLVLGFGLLLLGARAGSAPGVLAAWAAAPLVAIVLLARAVAAAWPLAGREVSCLRAAVAAIVLVAVMRVAGRLRRAPAHRGVVIAACVVGAALACASFYNLGRPQFWHHGERRPLFVHTTDMRIYQPFAKYFDELRYDGVYAASVLAYAEDERDGALSSLGSVEIRDQRDHKLRRVADLTGEINAVRARFTDARWADFKRDVTFFRAAMGNDFLTTLNDHGANATPVWVLLARLVLGHVPATEATLTAGGLVDAGLFVAIAIAIGLSFGGLPMLVAMTVFGANELYMFGTNWAGATLRHEWLAPLAFAACALHRRRWALGGALLGLATALRVFPGVALIGILLPPLLWLGSEWRAGRRPTLATLRAAHGDALRVLAAAALTIVAAVLLTGALYSFAAWGQWAHKILMVNSDTAVNEINLRALIAGNDPAAVRELAARRWLMLAAQAGAVVLVARAVRGRPLDQAMLLALPLALALTNTVNYHDHFVFLLVLVGVGGQGNLARASLPLLAFGVAGYWAALEPDPVLRFGLLTAFLFAALGWFYANVLRSSSSPDTVDSR